MSLICIVPFTEFVSILFTVPATWQCVDHKNVVIPDNRNYSAIKYHVFHAVTNSELTELVPVFTIRPALPTWVKKVNTSFKNVWRTWGPALPTLLADLMIFCPLGNFISSLFRFCIE
jgi:hypothetical protein